MQVGFTYPVLVSFRCGPRSRVRDRFAFRERVLGRQIAVPSQKHVRIGQTSVGESIAGVFVDLLLKVLERFVEAFFRPPVPMMTALQVEPLSLGIFRVAFDQTLFFRPG